jgi:DNA-binding response OmpR family regulator
MSIVVIDDDADISWVLKQFLQGIGYNAVSFTDPLLAFEHLKHNHNNCSLIITDLRMPGMSGIEIANKIRKELNNNVKIFLITAFCTEDLDNRLDFKDAKIDRIIQKPIKLSTLKKIVSLTLQIPDTKK